MKEYLATKKYIPTREFFKELSHKDGYFTDYSLQKDQPEASKGLDKMVTDVAEMEEIIRKNFLQSEVSKKEFYSLNPVQNDLRRKCEEQRLLIDSLEKEIEKLRLTMQNDNQADEKDTAK
jgi:hypothetical protein